MAEGQTRFESHEAIAHRLPAVPQDTSRPQVDAALAPGVDWNAAQPPAQRG